MLHGSSRTLVACAALAAGVLLAAGCSSGSGGSDVGSETNLPPIARALVVNSGATNTVREGAEVQLTARDSEDPDGPLLDWTWSAPAGIQLVERTRTTVSFTAPDVDAPTTYTFDVTVLDSHNLGDSTSVDVTVVPAGDPNRFLAPRATLHAPSDAFTLTAALPPGASAGASDAPFTINVEALVRYTSRAGSIETFALDIDELALPIEGTWPAGETVTCAAGQSDTECMLDSYVNSDFRLRVPRLDITEINQHLLEAGEPNRQLDQHMTGFAVIEITAYFDAGMLQDHAALLVSAGGQLVAESEPSVIGIPATLTVSAEELLAAMPGEESAATAEIYYQTVDPLFRRTTLNDWLFNAGFAADTEGTLLPEAVNGEGEFAHVLYLNNYDLGFGRDMYTRVEPDGDVYAFVVNYPTLDAGLRKTDELVTVVMEFTPPDDPSLHASCLAKGRFVKFFTFAPDDQGDSQRIGSMNFDGRGERHTPGNCATCHGGSTANLDEIETGAWGQPVYRDCGDTNSAFMAWDLDAFLYSDDDPAIVNAAARPDGTPLVDYLDPAGRWTRAAQEEQFRKMNAAALSTYQTYIAEGGDPERVAAIADLVHGWYSNEPDVPGRTFDGSYTPVGWSATAQVADAYHESFARFCRACHSLRPDSPRQFRSYDDFVLDPLTGSPRALEDLIYRRGIMPLARLTMDRFWVPFEGGSGNGAGSAAIRLAEVLAADPRVSLVASARPGRAVFDITRTPDPAKELDLVRLNAADSGFVDAPQWTALAATENGACVTPALIAANTLEVAFRATTAGRYCLQLSSGGDSTVVEFDVAANQPPQRVAKLPLVIDENAGPTSIDLEHTDPDDEASKLLYTLAATLYGEVTLDGTVLSAGDTFTQQQIDAGFVRFEPMYPANLAEGATVAGGIDYSITDGFATSGGPGGPPLEYRVSIRGVNDGQPSVTVLAPVTPAQLTFDGSVAIGHSRITADDPDSPPSELIVSISVNGGAPAGSISPAQLTYQQILDGSSFTYTHSGNFPIDLSDVLSVTVSDGASTTSPAAMSVNARVSFASNIVPIVDDPADSNNSLQGVLPHLADDCASCHNSGAPYGAPSFLLEDADADHDDDPLSYANFRNGRVDLADPICANPAAEPSSLLLRWPTAFEPHPGAQRPGFDPGGNRNNLDLFRVWICSFNALNN